MSFCFIIMFINIQCKNKSIIYLTLDVKTMEGFNY